MKNKNNVHNLIPSGAANVIARLTAAGHQAYLVGGAVRDIIMYGSSLPESDCDIATSATPDETMRVFSDLRVIETGIKHGTVTVILDGTPYEVTTYRTELGYGDSRHPDRVEFVTDITDDLARRDFTMNAIAASPDGTVVDPFGGAADIASRTIRAVGDPSARFSEDALRILRGLRFAARFGFALEPSTAAAMYAAAPIVARVSGERVREELSRLLLGAHATELLIDQHPTVARALPHFADATAESYDTAARAVSRQRLALPPRLAALLSCLPDPAPMLDRLVLDRATRNRTELLLREAPALALPPATEPDLLRFASRLDADAASDLLSYRAALEPSAVNATPFATASARLDRLVSDGACYQVSQLAIGGGDLVARGYPPSKEISRLLALLLDAVIDRKVENTPSDLVRYLERVAPKK